jgi:cap1 methyltransferase
MDNADVLQDKETRDSKKRSRGSDIVVQEVPESRRDPSTDYYDVITKGGFFRDKNGKLLQSWLADESWFSQYRLSASRKIGNEELGSLQSQLLLIKRRLMPTARDAAAAYNAYIDQMDDLEELSPRELFSKVRGACNPMEALGEGRAGGLNTLFVNRSAIKLANINASLGFMLCQNATDGCFNFIDLCSAPGGFSEYLIHHSQRLGIPFVRGFGMSLIGANEHGKGTRWKINSYQDSRAHYRICTGADGTGDVYNYENVLALRRDVGEVQVHAVLCDGGVDAQRDHENQEELAQKLILCQTAAALSILGSGGSLVIKIFGCQTEVMRIMLRDLTQRFQDFIITKPISSRPASAERYLIMSGFRGVQLQFDGRKWLDSIVLGRTFKNPTLSLLEGLSDLESYINQVDHDMLLLNIKACFAILSSMENVIRRSDVGMAEHDVGVEINAYRIEWSL